MKYTQLQTNGLATNIKRVFVLDIDNQQDFINDPVKYDTPGTLLIGCVFEHNKGVLPPIKQFVNNLSNAHARIWSFEGDTIKEYADHFLTMLSTYWIEAKKYLKEVPWTICSNDKSAQCTAKLLNFMGVEECYIHSKDRSSNTISKGNALRRNHSNYDVIEKIPRNVHLNEVTKYVNRNGGKVKLFGCGVHAQLKKVLVRHGFKVTKGLIVS